ncbi:hypothetical protein LMG18090_04366 [Ralstonia mannitolilytica]|uniref:hypothetical protein n=1 Tax=Ralstonia mannitolilytica TaxID=105219 RepID=UPI0028F52F29|nr:hypothetical protein [Ralstonia mannitolilytica]CAJ0802959.1 hypothetical protein LMG18090_04366 [Ralstonia mannitolilytica]
MADDFESFLQQNAQPAPGPQTDAPAAPTMTPEKAPADPFESFLQGEKDQYLKSTTQRAQAVAVSNSTASAAAAGQAARIGRQIGIPQPAVEADLPRYEAQAKAEENARVLADDPKFAQWVAGNPDAARVAQDDFGSMSTIGKIVSGAEAGGMGLLRGLGASFNSAALAVNRAIPAAARYLLNPSGANPESMIPGAQPRTLSSLVTGQSKSTNPVEDWWNRNFVQPLVEAQPALATPDSASFGVKAASTVGNLLGTLSQITLTGGGGEAPAAANAAKTAVQAIGETVAHGARAMAFPSLTAAINTGHDVYDQTGDIGQAVRAAQMAYGTTTLGGVVPLGAPGGLATRLVTGAVSGAVSGEVSRQAMNLVMPQQQGFDPEQLILSGLTGSLLSGVMGPRALHEGVRQAAADSLRAETAERGGDALAKLSELVAGSKLREHDPDSFREYVRQASEDGQLTDVYVDGNVLAEALHQSAVDPNNIPGLPDRLAEAQRTGGDVQIPIEDYATHIAGTPIDKAILPNLKVEEGGMTYAEGQQFFQSAKEDMAARAQEIANQHQQEAAGDEEVKAIGDKLFQQMQATGHFPDDVSRASIAPVTEFYRTMAERVGMTPGELFEKAPLRIVGEDVGGGLEKGGERGAFNPDTRTVALLQHADLSTFLHESGHFFLSTLGDLAARPEAPPQIRQDMETAIKWMGGKDLADWQARTLDQQRDMHEKFARGFEAYLMEGKAPNATMQSLFSRFRSWLVNVYRSISGLNAELTPEVRGVFDRLLASDETIRQTEQQRGYFPLDLSKSGATEKQLSDYAALGQQATSDAVGDMQARSLRDMKWASNAKSRALKALQREAATERKAIRDEVTKEVKAEPVERAREFLKSGKVLDENGQEGPDLRPLGSGDAKLNAEDVKAMYPESMLNRPDLDALRGMTSKNGMHPDMVAEMFGIGSGDELVRSLTSGEKPADRIARLTDERMLQRHGELVDPAAIEAAANEAVHNEARARFMATGLKILAKSPIPARELARAATEAAEKTIAAKRLRDVNPRQYEVAEAKANKEAIAQAPKDPAAALQAQRQALLSNRLAKAARDAAAQIKKIVDSQKRYDRDSIRSKMDPDVLEQIDALRERFDFRQAPPDGPTKEQVALQTWVDTQKAFGYAPVQHPDMLNPTVRMHYKDMTVEQLRGFNDTIRSLEQIAKERKSVMIDGKKADLAEVVSGLVDKMKARGEKFTTQELVDRPRAGVDSIFKVTLDRVASFLRASAAEFKGQQFKANQFDMHEVMGPFTKAIFERVFGANYRKVDMLKSLSMEFRASAEKLGVDWQKSLLDVVPNTRLIDADLTQERGEPVYRRLTRGDMLGIARHVGNESNFDKLTRGMGWAPGDVWAFLNEHMTAKDWQATQATWDAFEKHWPEMVEMNKRLGNVSPDHIEPRAFKTADGIDLRGGYAPIDYDPLRSKLAVRKADASAINPSEGLFGKSYFRADTTTNGSLNARTGYIDRLDLDFHSLEKRLHDTIHDLAYREALLDVHKILSNQDFRRQFLLSYGPEQYKSLQQWVGDLANGQNSDAQMSRLGQIMNATRRMVVANGIALRVSTVLKHGGAAGLKSLGYFSGGGEKYFAARVAKMATDNSGQIQGAIEKFPEIRARLMQQDRDFRQTSSSLFQSESLHAKAERFGHAAVAYSDMMTAVPTAWAAYDRAITEGIPKNRGGTGKPMSEEDAVRYASQIVREAHSSNIESARSMILQDKNEAVKMFTTLYGFMNNSLGQHMDMVDKFRTAGFSKPEVLARYMMAMIVPALWTGMVHKPDKEEGWAHWVAGSITGEYAAMVPMLREAWSALEGHSSAGVPSYMSVLGAIGKPISDLYKAAKGDEVKAPIKDLGNALGLAIPGLGQIGTTLQYAADVKQGKAHPHTIADAFRGYAMGQNTD